MNESPPAPAYPGRVTWSNYATFLVFAVVVIVAPGPDFAVVLKNSLAGGRAAGTFSSLGVLSSSFVQATAAAFGVGAVVARSQPLFEAVRWAGVCYLAYLAFQALRSAWRGDGALEPVGADDGQPSPRRFVAWRQGFLSNITNPKVLALYLSVLPQFLQPGETSPLPALALAYTFVALSVLWLGVVVWFLHRVGSWLRRRRVRRAMSAVTGVALAGFAVKLATESR